MFNINHKFILVAAIAAYTMAGCSSTKEDDVSLESQEPVEAEAPSKAQPDAKIPPSVALPEESSVAAPPAASSGSAANAGSAPINTTHRVMYVKVDGAVLREKPEPKSKVIGKLEKGDHLLVTIEGEWARTDNGKYVSTKVLSEKGIGRGKRDATWSGGSPGSFESKAKLKNAGSSKPSAVKKSVKKELIQKPEEAKVEEKKPVDQGSPESDSVAE